MNSLSILTAFFSRLSHLQEKSGTCYMFGNRLHNFTLFLKNLFNVKHYYQLNAKDPEILITFHRV